MFRVSGETNVMQVIRSSFHMTNDSMTQNVKLKISLLTSFLGSYSSEGTMKASIKVYITAPVVEYKISFKHFSVNYF